MPYSDIVCHTVNIRLHRSTGPRSMLGTCSTCTSPTVPPQGTTASSVWTTKARLCAPSRSRSPTRASYASSSTKCSQVVRKSYSCRAFGTETRVSAPSPVLNWCPKILPTTSRTIANSHPSTLVIRNPSRCGRTTRMKSYHPGTAAAPFSTSSTVTKSKCTTGESSNVPLCCNIIVNSRCRKQYGIRSSYAIRYVQIRYVPYDMCHTICAIRYVQISHDIRMAYDYAVCHTMILLLMPYDY
jgi:hypothetical protein